MDMKMPGIEGPEATRRIKEMKKDLPVIAQTAYAMSGEKEKILEAGCDDYLSKPLGAEKLLETVIKWLAVRS